jgi:alanyl-tRNA synthetase
MTWNRKKLISEYINFFKKKDHREIPNSSLVPENDPTVLFTTAGMHPLVPFLLGQKHPQGKRLVNVQRCIRTGDIEEVGDPVHHTFFEMLGNWSLGDYFKEEAIKMTFEFHTKILKILLERYAVTCFAGNKNAERDEESSKIWQSLEIAKERIAFLEEDNFWQLTGAGPCGPCTEQFFWMPNNIKAPKQFNPKDCNWVEIGNDVLMQYVKDKNREYKLAKQKNIDFGGGVERTLAVLNGFDDNYLTEIWQPIIQEIEHLSGKKYGKSAEETRAMRIIADHIKASVFIIADGVVPGNVERGYVLRRLLRRAIMNLRKLGFTGTDLIEPIAEKVFTIYDDYDILKKNRSKILKEINREEEKFEETIENGLKEFDKLSKSKQISGKDAFLLYQSYGFPVEMTCELAREKNIGIDLKGCHEETKRHQELSRTASAGQFKSGLADNSEATTKLHTAAHLLLAALKKVLGTNVHQRGSNITPERLRLDFSFDRKMTEDEIKKVESLVNEQIKNKEIVVCEELDLDKAKKSGAEGVFDDKYKNLEKVKVYSLGKFSKEICSGPHVKNTGDLGKFKIQKEESSSSGVRRIKAVLEKF